MGIGQLILRIKYFFDRDIWVKDLSESRLLTRFAYATMQRIFLTIKCFVTSKLTSTASALTYSTILSIVPILTIVFAIARGFGYNKVIERQLQSQFQGQESIAEYLLSFVNSYLNHTQNGFFIGFGLILLLVTLISLVRGIESSFNSIWQVKHMRSTIRMFVDYSAIMLLLPIFLIVSIGINVFVSTHVNELNSFIILGPMAKLGLRTLPILLMSCLFTSLYLFLPNVRVKLRGALIGGVSAGVLFQIIQYFYIHSQMWMTSYNAIYGSFAAIPLFMILCQVLWNVCLLCAQFSYIDQNIDNFYYGKDTPNVSHRVSMYISLALMSDICKNFLDNGTRSDAASLASNNKLPIRLINDVLYALCISGLIAEVVPADEKEEDTHYIPARDVQSITIRSVVTELEKIGDEGLLKDLDENMTSRWLRIRHLYDNIGMIDDMNKNITQF